MIDDSIYCCRVMSSRLRSAHCNAFNRLCEPVLIHKRVLKISLWPHCGGHLPQFDITQTHTHTRFHSHSRAHYICPLSRSHEQRSDNMPTVSGEIWLRLVVKPRVNILLFFQFCSRV